MGRPRKNINKDSFEKLCFLQCTLIEIASFFSCSEDTIENWCKREYKMSFTDVFNKYSAGGKISLRRAQFKLAEKYPNMAIFLGKQYLGQNSIGRNRLTEESAENVFTLMRQAFSRDREDEQGEDEN